MWAPVIIGGAGLVYLLRKREGVDVHTRDEVPDEATAAKASANEWNAAWGTPNEWDKRYPDARPDRPAPVNWSDFDPEFARRLRAAFDTMEAQSFDPFVYEGARTQRRQAYLYGQGRPTFATYGRAGKVVTRILDASKHGAYPVKAADVVSRTTWWNDPKFFEAWGKAAEAQGLRWLGNTSLGDKPHVELK